MMFEQLSRTAADQFLGLKVESTQLSWGRWRNGRDAEFLRAVIASVTDTRPSFALLLAIAVAAVGRIREGDDLVDTTAVGALGTRGIGPDDAGTLGLAVGTVESGAVSGAHNR